MSLQVTMKLGFFLPFELQWKCPRRHETRSGFYHQGIVSSRVTLPAFKCLWELARVPLSFRTSAGFVWKRPL